jgi:hypothetical protein
LAKGNGYAQVAHTVGLGVATIYGWRRDDPVFNAACQGACELIGDIAESVLLDRGMKGDTLALLAWLRAHRPQLYYRKMVVAGDPDSPVLVDHQHEHTVARPPARVVVLPDNNRHAMTEKEIQAERDSVTREAMFGFNPEPKADQTADETETADQTAAETETETEPDQWQTITVKPRA